MRHLISMTLLIGYVALVPFCFFGGAMIADAGTTNNIAMSSMHEMDDCVPETGVCMPGMAHGQSEPVSDHVGMYNSITQTPLVMLFVVLATLIAFASIAFVLSKIIQSALLTRAAVDQQKNRTGRSQSVSRQRVLTWLALFEASPNFA